MNNKATLDFETLIAQQSENNPKLKMLYQLMQQQQQNSQNTESQTNTRKKGQLQKLVHLNRALIRKNKKLKHQIKHLVKYLNFFIDVNTVFSSAVGACECWGEDPGCNHCHGKGQPGHFDVDEQAFREYVMPCIQVSEAGHETATPPKKEYKHVPNN